MIGESLLEHRAVRNHEGMQGRLVVWEDVEQHTVSSKLKERVQNTAAAQPTTKNTFSRSRIPAAAVLVASRRP